MTRWRDAPIGLVLALLSGCGDPGTAADDDGADAGDCTPVTEDLTPPEGATLKFMDPCVAGQDAQCETNLCYTFNMRGPHCTARCTQACECPPPSGGCNNMGVCKAP
jgi:hypothetical protein